MAFLLENAFNGSAYVNESANYPLLRLFTSKKDSLTRPQYEQSAVEEAWAVSGPKAVSQDVRACVHACMRACVRACVRVCACA